MSKAAMSIFVFGIYVVIIGILFIVVPNTVLSIIGVPETDEVWVRVVGLLAAVLGYYFIQAARDDLVPFFKATVYGRPVYVLGLLTFVVVGLGEPMLIGFGLIDLAGAIWTGLALRST